MTRQLILTLPDPLYQRLSRVAQQRRQDEAAVVLEYLDHSLPDAAEGPPAEAADESRLEEALAREEAAFIKLHPTLKRKYPGEYVAILYGAMIDHDADFTALYERVRASHPQTFVWISRVTDEPMETVNIRSPRLVSAD